MATAYQVADDSVAAKADAVVSHTVGALKDPEPSDDTMKSISDLIRDYHTQIDHPEIVASKRLGALIEFQVH